MRHVSGAVDVVIDAADKLTDIHLTMIKRCIIICDKQ